MYTYILTCRLTNPSIESAFAEEEKNYKQKMSLYFDEIQDNNKITQFV